MHVQGIIRKMGSMTPAELAMRKSFISFQIFKRGRKKIIVGTTSPILFHLDNPYIEIIEDKGGAVSNTIDRVMRRSPKDIRRKMAAPHEVPWASQNVEKLALVQGTERDYRTRMEVYLLNG